MVFRSLGSEVSSRTRPRCLWPGTAVRDLPFRLAVARVFSKCALAHFEGPEAFPFPRPGADVHFDWMELLGVVAGWPKSVCAPL